MNKERLELRIRGMKPINILTDILGFYKCPIHCAATCCRLLDIPVDMESIERISKKKAEYKQILDTLIPSNHDIVINGLIFTSDKMFPVKPCPFLNGIKCEINNIKPDSCKLYPFILGQLENTSSPDFPVKFEIAMCEMGFEILLDYTVFGTLFSRQMGLDHVAFANEQIGILKNEFYNDRREPINIINCSFPCLDVLRSFLFYLKSHKNVLIDDREDLRTYIKSLIEEGNQ